MRGCWVAGTDPGAGDAEAALSQDDSIEAYAETGV